VFRRLVSAIGLLAGLALAGLAPAMVAGVAHAQVNIDQGKSPSEMFASDCATCHKGVRGLAVGKNSLMLSGFLREHYTASREEAASLAAYVLGAGGAEAAPKGEPKIAEPKGQEPKEPKTAAHPAGASAKAEEGSATAKPQPPAAEEAKHEELASPTSPADAGGQVPPPAPAVESAKPEPREAVPATASPTASQPAAAEAPSLEFGPTRSAAVPAQSQPSDSTSVPRDNIPD
jgi:hypothetical protein